MAKTYSSISIFSGAGGIDCGLRAAGYETLVAIDADEDSVASLNENKVGFALERDVASVSPKELLAAAGTGCGNIDLLTAGPPCQPFSKSANWKHGAPLGLADPRAQTLQHLMRLIEGTLPKVVLIENVPGFARGGERSALQKIIIAFEALNAKHGTSYVPHAFQVDAASFGVPQHRKRLIVILDRDGRSFLPPRSSHGETHLEELLPFVTAWEAIGNLASTAGSEDLCVRGKWADLLPSVPEGCNYLWHTDRGGGVPLFGWRTRYWSFLLKLAKDRPSWTISANPSQNTGPFHWQDRQLSAEELARLQSFPSSWTVVGRRASQVRQIGNAVPPLLAEVIGREIRAQLLGGRRSKLAPKLSFSRDLSPPPPEQPSNVPRKYLHLKGTHPPHPGHGLGPGAVLRSSDRATTHETA